MDRDLEAPTPVDTARLAVSPVATTDVKGVFLLLPVPVVGGTLSVELDAAGAGVALPSFFAVLGFAFGFALALTGGFLGAAYR